MSICICDASWGQEIKIPNSVSPKLREFLAQHPTASETLSNVLTEAFTNRTLRLYYFYSEDESVPRASHDYPDNSVVAIFIRENQQPLDEFVSLLFEALNSTSENEFCRLFAQAKSAAVPKSEFTRDVCTLEFDAVRRTRNLLIDIKLSKGERNKSHYYKLFMGVPNNFADFLLYTKNVSSPQRDLVKEWGAKYDLLQKQK
jgi:hypothetical protein